MLPKFPQCLNTSKWLLQLCHKHLSCSVFSCHILKQCFVLNRLQTQDLIIQQYSVWRRGKTSCFFEMGMLLRGLLNTCKIYLLAKSLIPQIILVCWHKVWILLLNQTNSAYPRTHCWLQHKTVFNQHFNKLHSHFSSCFKFWQHTQTK